MTISTKKSVHLVCSIHGADKESVNYRYISVYRPFMSVSIIEYGAVDNRYMSIIGRLRYITSKKN